jgi:hypothetical protein
MLHVVVVVDGGGGDEDGAVGWGSIDDDCVALNGVGIMIIGGGGIDAANIDENAA